MRLREAQICFLFFSETWRSDGRIPPHTQGTGRTNIQRLKLNQSLITEASLKHTWIASGSPLDRRQIDHRSTLDRPYIDPSSNLDPISTSCRPYIGPTSALLFCMFLTILSHSVSKLVCLYRCSFNSVHFCGSMRLSTYLAFQL